MQLKKNINLGRIKFVFVIVVFFQFLNINVFSEISENTEKFAEILILDKVSSKSTKLKAIFNVESNFMDNMDYDYCFRKGIHVLATSPVFAQPVAEMAMGLTLSLSLIHI